MWRYLACGIGICLFLWGLANRRSGIAFLGGVVTLGPWFIPGP